jgi:hypothetical protein
MGKHVNSIEAGTEEVPSKCCTTWWPLLAASATVVGRGRKVVSLLIASAANYYD